MCLKRKAQVKRHNLICMLYFRFTFLVSGGFLYSLAYNTLPYTLIMQMPARRFKIAHVEEAIEGVMHVVLEDTLSEEINYWSAYRGTND